MDSPLYSPPAPSPPTLALSPSSNIGSTPLYNPSQYSPPAPSPSTLALSPSSNIGSTPLYNPSQYSPPAPSPSTLALSPSSNIGSTPLYNPSQYSPPAPSPSTLALSPSSNIGSTPLYNPSQYSPPAPSPPTPTPQYSPPAPSPPTPTPQYSPPAPSSPAPSLPAPSSPAPSPPAPTPSPSSNTPLYSMPTNPSNQAPPGGMPPGAMAGLITGILVAIIVLIGLGIFVFRYRRKKREEAESLGGGEPKDGPNTGLPRQQSPFTYEELSRATDNFSMVNLLGQGGFGYVYKGVLSNGEVVAVKRLKIGSGQGEREFQAEIETITRVHHRHLVSLVGHCITGDQRLLVYEFLPNNTLAFHLHGKQRPVMKWATRMKVATGSAKGLAYLHEDCQPKIIHRDIKAANILLDHSFEAKVADFGLAKYFSDTDTHVSTRVIGTFGYMAPEYASSGKLTEKSDVFSFGVLLLELVTGRLPVDRTPSSLYDCIVDWARPLLQQALQLGNYDALVDPKLQKDYDSSEITRVIACAAACVNHSARHRPRMSQIVRALEGNISLEDLNKGTAPGYFKSHISYESSDYSSGQYKEDLVKFRMPALESKEQSSSEYSAYTSDYAMNPSSSSTEGRQTTEERGEKC